MKLLNDPLRDFKVLSHSDTFEGKIVKEKLIELHPSGEVSVGMHFGCSSQNLIPVIPGSELNGKLENIIKLPCRFGGLGIAFPRKESEVAYNCSREMCRPLLERFSAAQLACEQGSINLKIAFVQTDRKS
ncbi:hypothetical protein GJ496_003165 [Pomphorhynchus laevis]|nr:hypothetical protein GJ496_003165 [Pomphorhynchus laevis]